MSLYIGIMSGTSLDGLDIALTSIDANKIKLLDSLYIPFPSNLRAELLQLCSPTDNEIQRLSLAEQAWVRLAAQGINQLLERNRLVASKIAAIGSHGQTIRHHPEQGFSIQIGNPALLAELTGIKVISHFRQRDIAAGGQGAPLVPAFHHWLFADIEHAAILNIGGFSNITFLHANGKISGFDCGPGNVLIDTWIQQQKGFAYDRNGEWAASGAINHQLLAAMLADDFFQQQGPRSTGRELFNAQWIQLQLSKIKTIEAADVQSTLTELTASAITNAIKQEPITINKLLVCGGGAHNKYLLERLQSQLGQDCGVCTTDDYGVPADWMEAMAFAWLAWCCEHNKPANCPAVTGAKGPRVLGAIYPA